MTLELPSLDDRRYADLVAEARRLIPILDPDWTDHNPSDPGITLIEMFAYVTEMLLYRLDRVTVENQHKFLRLLEGPDWTPGENLDDDIRHAVLTVRARERAVTAADFERLATEDFNQWLGNMRQREVQGEPFEEWWQVTQLDRADPGSLPSHVPLVARAACVTSRNLDGENEAVRTKPAPAHVSLIVLPQAEEMPQPPSALKTALWWYLDERRTLTTRHHVVGPRYAPIRAEIVIAATTGASLDAVHGRVVGLLKRFLDPLAGGVRQDGWPFGRDVYVSELYEQIEAVDGVDYISDLMLSAVDPLPGNELAAQALQLWHPEGDLIGMALEPHHLPRARTENDENANKQDDTILVAPSPRFVPVRLAVTATRGANADTAKIKRAVKGKVREFLHPLYQGPGPSSSGPADLALASLKSALQNIAGVTKVNALDLQADAPRLVKLGGQVVGLHVQPGEIINWQTLVTVPNG